MDSLAAYYADGVKARDREPLFNSDLGLAVEALPDGLTLAQLWNIV